MDWKEEEDDDDERRMGARFLLVMARVTRGLARSTKRMDGDIFAGVDCR